MHEVRVVSGRPRAGHELPYMLALKHRDGHAWLLNRTPWYQIRKKARRFEAWMRAIDRFHQHGTDLVYRVH